MNTDQKAAALLALGEDEFAVKFRRPGDWYAVCAGEIGDGVMLTSTMGNGRTPDEAIDALWQKMTSLKPGERIVLGAYSSRRRAVRWNGFMWEHVNEDRAA